MNTEYLRQTIAQPIFIYYTTAVFKLFMVLLMQTKVLHFSCM